MKKPFQFIFILIITLGFVFVGAADVPLKKVDPAQLSLEDFYKVKGFRGKTARDITFSPDDSYLAFLWNGYGKAGTDLFIYHISKDKLIRVTSLEIMKKFDPPKVTGDFIKKKKQKDLEDFKTQEAYFAQRDFLQGKDVDLGKFEREELEMLKEELRKEKEKAEAGKKLEKSKEKKKKKSKKIKKEKEAELELWELRDKLKEWKEKNKVKNSDLYPGVKEYKWANQSGKLIFQYRGDLFSYNIQSAGIQRLTLSEEKESILGYTADDSGYYYSVNQKVYRVKFESGYKMQINPRRYKNFDKETLEKVSLYKTYVSPDDRWALVIASKKEDGPAPRKIKYMDYSKRFAEPIETVREVGDDKRNEPSYYFYLRPITKMSFGNDPEPVFEIPGGDTWYDFGPVKWSKDSKKYAFITWEREKGDLKVWLGNAGPGEKPVVLYQKKELVGYEFWDYRHVVFSPDGQYLAVTMNTKKGMKQPAVIDLSTGKMKFAVTGDFESHPVLGFSKDNAYLFVESDKADQSMHSIYRITLATGEMIRVGKSGGMHRRSTVSHNGQYVAGNFGNWEKWSELYLLEIPGEKEKILTDSHNKQWRKYDFIRPELFKYKNRHGHTISGMVFKPLDWQPQDKRPGLVYVYGGPLGTAHDIETDALSSLSYMFQMIMAAKHGYVAINIDPRGMTGYGRDFSEANFNKVGVPQTEDLEDLVKHVSSGFGVDREKLGLHGWSFGGFQTLMTMLTSPDTFACGIATASVTEWENYNYYYTGSVVADLIRGKPHMKKFSLIPLAGNLKKPLLLIHGMKDDNVLYQDTVNIYNALLKAGKETLVDLFLDPEGNHGLRGSVPNKSVFKKYESWFLRHLGKFGK